MDVQELTIEARVKNLSQVIQFVDRILESADCPMKTQMQIDIAVEEIFVNIAHYAYAPGKGDATLRMEITGDPATAVLVFTDSGVPYNPLLKEDPDVSLPAFQRKIGGLGIFMAKKNVDEMSYEYKDGCNVLTLKKRLLPPEKPGLHTRRFHDVKQKTVPK